MMSVCPINCNATGLNGQVSARGLFAAALILALVCLPSPARAEEWASKIPIGATFPQIKALDQNNRELDNGNLHGSNGLLFVFVRSTSW